MASRRQGPFGLLRQLTAELDRTFATMFGGAERGGEAAWMPRIDVRQSEGKFRVRADLPGVERDDVNVEVRGDALWIEGQRRECEDNEDGGYQECVYGSFLRVLPLPEGADFEHGSARFENGVLEIEIPTQEERTQRRRIDVEGAKAAEAIGSASRAAAREAEQERAAAPDGGEAQGQGRSERRGETRGAVGGDAKHA